ncbi:MAG: GMC oxidoreductase [Geminicoccaceae bacterium]
MARHLRLNSSAETLPDYDNRIDVDFDAKDSVEVPRPRVVFTVDDYTRKGLANATAWNVKIMKELGATRVSTDDPYLSTAIICGTARMGEDPKRSVVSPELRAHDHHNLFIVGTSAHLTAPVNAPTLTAAANSLRVAEVLMAELGGRN